MMRNRPYGIDFQKNEFILCMDVSVCCVYFHHHLLLLVLCSIRFWVKFECVLFLLLLEQYIKLSKVNKLYEQSHTHYSEVKNAKYCLFINCTEEIYGIWFFDTIPSWNHSLVYNTEHININKI